MSPLVSINIPTFNSEKILEATLESVFNSCINLEALKNKEFVRGIEIIVIDSYSSDRTLQIAKRYGAKIVMCNGKLLEARIAGVNASKGKYVLFLDSDQTLGQSAIIRAVEKMKKYDYLWFYERSKNKGFLPSLYDADRILTQKYLEEGVVLPRFFKRSLLLKAIKKIPKQHIPVCGAQDHIVLHHEVRKISKKIGKVEHAVWHFEPDSLLKLFKKQYRWGKTTRAFYDRNIYRVLITKKNCFRSFYKDDLMLSFKSFILRIFRGVPYIIGFYLVGKR